MLVKSTPDGVTRRAILPPGIALSQGLNVVGRSPSIRINDGSRPLQSTSGWQTFPSRERVGNAGIKYGRVKERPGAAVPYKDESKEVWTQPNRSCSKTPRRL